VNTENVIKNLRVLWRSDRIIADIRMRHIDLVDLMEHGEIPTAPIFLDSPLAIRATEVFRRHAASLDQGIDVSRLLSSPHLRFTETVDESKSIAKLTGFHIVIAASGMCDAGRIRHHLRQWLWNSRGTVLLVGFQSNGNARPVSSGWRQSRPDPG
jgi:metallo-beta-lactamase family protein